MRSAIYDDNKCLGRIRGSREATERLRPRFHCMMEANRSACETGGVETIAIYIYRAGSKQKAQLFAKTKCKFHCATHVPSRPWYNSPAEGSYDTNQTLVEKLERRELMQERYLGVQQRYYARSIGLDPHLLGKSIAKRVHDIRPVESRCNHDRQRK